MSQKKTELIALAKELNGKHLRIGTYNNYPLSWVEKHENGTVSGRGVAFTVVDILREKFNFTFEVVVPEMNYEVGGTNPEDSLIGLVNTSKVDMAAAFLPKITRLENMVDFSSNLDEGTWMMMLKRPKESAAGSGLLAPFETHVWYLILAAVLSYGPCITLLTHLRSRLVRDREPKIPLSPSCWFVYGAFIKQGTTLSPDANTTRVLFATWWLFIILLSAFYTANLTAFLTLSKFTLDIETPRDLLKKNYRWVATEGGSVQYIVHDSDEALYFLSPMIEKGRAVFRSYASDYDYLPMVKGGAVLVKEQTAIDHLMYNDYLMKAREGVEETERCTYVVAPSPFMFKIRAFAFPLNSTLKTLFDPVLTCLLQAGIVDFLETRDLPTTKICPLDLQSKDRKLRNSDLMMTYMIMVVGLAAGAAVFAGEMMLKHLRKKHLKVLDVSRIKELKPEKSSQPTGHDESSPPPYESLFGKHKSTGNSRNARKRIINGREYWVFNLDNEIMARFGSKKCRLLSMLWLTGSFFFVELIVGYFTNSMALVADSFHMLSDVAALVVAFLSVKMSPKKWSKNTFGWARAEVLGALVNAVFLVALCFSITVEAVKRFIETEEIHDAQLLVAVGGLGLLINIIGLFLFHEHGSSHGHSHGGVPPPANVRHLTELVNSNADMALGHNAAEAVAGADRDDTDQSMLPKAAQAQTVPTKQTPRRKNNDPGHMNMKGVFLHVLSDALGSIIVVCSALIVWKTNWSYRLYIDPALSIVLVILILVSVWPLLRESALILLQTVPTHIQVDAIQQRLLEKVDGVLAVHEFHVWQLAGDRIIASAHIRCRNLSEYMKIAEKVKEFFHNEGIHSTTIQPEFVELPLDGNEVSSGEGAEPPCALHCPPSDLCHNATCCGPHQQERSTPSPGLTPYLCRQRSMGSRADSLNSHNDGHVPDSASARHLDALECGSLLPSPAQDVRFSV